MTTASLTKALLKIPEIQTECLWFIENYKDSNTHPWDKYFENIYTDIDLKLPSGFDNEDTRTFIGLTILAGDYQLIEGDLPRQYFLTFNDVLVQDIEDLGSHIVECAANLVVAYYNADKNNEISKLEKGIERFVHNWNSDPYVKQEEVINILSSEFSTKTDLPIGLIIKIISDFHRRFEAQILWNYRRCLLKAEELLHEEPGLKEKAAYYNFIVNQFENGGKDLKSIYDLFPNYKGIQFN